MYTLIYIYTYILEVLIYIHTHIYIHICVYRVTNYGPNLAELARHSISAQDAPGNADLFQFISTTNIDSG
jgi:hypothetical protein